MIDAAALLNDIRALRARCSVVDGLDERVAFLSNKGRREATVASLDNTVQDISSKYKMKALAPMLESMFLVRSQSSAVGNKFISLVDDGFLHTEPGLQGAELVQRLDAGGSRYTLYGEFIERYAKLREKILQGRLDHLLNNDDSNLLHGILGQRGDLLNDIGWDASQGETYVKLNEPSPIEKNFDQVLKTDTLTVGDKNDLGDKVTPVVVDFLNRIINSANRTVPQSQAESARTTEDPDIAIGLPIAEDSDVAIGTLPIARNEAVRKKLGLALYPVYNQIAVNMKLVEGTQGLLVIKVYEGSSAQKAGFRASQEPATFSGMQGTIGGDIILEVEGTPVGSIGAFIDLIDYFRVKGTQVRITILRNHTRMDIHLHY